ncbi:CENP-Q, a CENPA-CAD centromere complex subunit-domain-containing protein [Plectosphaerella plurivora]|uniref:CENP-Q, a CENPA-CAD centromere complex subunit-domain-containing protein n=1 Tax=Plectosphaerella plurivora TaxID=936078 RepID=A0A9P8V327_9PEZI|nr:CENP-Q, a CENPA-CAD centromere complex subunit-domain-containing protein [Plectosphaerella plurivora]
MPPKTASKGGKRGRPPGASRPLDASQQQQQHDSELPQDLNEELSFEDQSTPKDGVVPPINTGKRGRRPRAAEVPAEPELTSQTTARASKTTQRTRKDAEVAEESTEATASSKPGKGRTRRVVEDHPDPAAAVDTTEHPAETAPKKKRGRPPKADTAQEPDAVEEEAEEPPAKRRRGRPSLQKAPAEPEAAPLQESNTRGNKGKRKASAAQTPQIEEEPPVKKPRRRKSTIVEPSVPTPEPRRPRGRPKTATEPAQSSSPKKAKGKASPAKKRRRTEDTPAETAAPEPPARRNSDTTTETPAPTIKARHISDKLTKTPESAIRDTWSPLDPPSIPLATSHLDLASLPVLQHFSTNIKRRDHAADVLRKVSSAITRRLRSFPLPPALTRVPQKRGPRGSQPRDPRDSELSPENVLDAVKSLQRSLDTLLDSRRLLETERDRQQTALEKEYAELDRLEGNARSAVRGLREQLRKAHPLVPEATPQGSKIHGDVGVRPVVDDGPGDVLFQDMDSMQLPGLDIQLANHMESLRANLGQVDGVVPEILQSRAALRGLLASHLGAEQLEHVVLG